MKAELFLEFGGKQIAEADIVKTAKKIWTDDGNKISDINSLDLYIKPEENKAYFVINENYTGNFPF